MRVPLALQLLPVKTIDLVQLADIILAWVLFGTGLAQFASDAAESPSPPADLWGYVVAISMSLPVVLRNRRPLAAWRVAAVMAPFTLGLVASVNDAPYQPGFVIMYCLVLYSLAVRCAREITVAAWLLSLLIAWAAEPGSLVVAAVVVTVSVLLGHNVRVRRSATARLAVEEQRTELAEAAQAVLEERARIARELHDVVAHHMSVIAIQAEAVPLKAAGDPVQLEEGLAEIRGLSLTAIRELRQVLGGCATRTGGSTPRRSPGSTGWTSSSPTRGRPGWRCWSSARVPWTGSRRRWRCPRTGSCRSR